MKLALSETLKFNIPVHHSCLPIMSLLFANFALTTPMQAKCSDTANFAPFSGPSSSTLFADSCSWSNEGGSPASLRNSDVTWITTKRAKTSEQLPDWNFEERDWCTDEISPISQREKISRYRRKRRIAAIISMLQYIDTALRSNGSLHWPANRDTNIDTSVLTPNDRPRLEPWNSE